MGKNAITYTFTAIRNNPYGADNGRTYNVASRIYLNGIIDAGLAQTIITEAGGTFLPDGVKPEKCDNKAKDKWFDPRFVEFSYSTGGGDPAGLAEDTNNFKVRVVVPDRQAIPGVTTAVRGALESGGARVNCIKLIGEDFMNILYDVGATLADPTTSPRFSPFVYAGRMDYDSDIGPDITLPFRMASDGEELPPSTLPIVGGPIEVITDSGRCPDRVRSYDPRHMIVTTMHAGGKQKTIVPISSDEAAEIAAAQTAMASNPAVYCLRYRGESQKTIERHL